MIIKEPFLLAALGTVIAPASARFRRYLAIRPRVDEGLESTQCGSSNTEKIALAGRIRDHPACLRCIRRSVRNAVNADALPTDISIVAGPGF
jgi:hypothetical protein